MSETREVVRHYPHPAAGWGALKNVAFQLVNQKIPAKGVITLLSQNQPDGFDCPGCAWPDKEHTSTFEFCENGVKAVAAEATAKKVTPAFFAKYTVAELMTWTDFQLEDQGRITDKVDYDPEFPVHTAWDLGYRDDTAIWWYQVVGREIRVIDFYAISGADIHAIAEVVAKKRYRYGKHHLPHDARAKSLQTGKSIVEQLADALGFAKLSIVPDIGVQDGIQAVRQMLPRVWFNSVKCAEGLEALRQYQREYDDNRKAFRASPRHDWTSHPSDAFRMMAVAWRQEPTVAALPDNKTLIVGPQNQVSLNDMWAAHDRQSPRRARI